MCTRGGHDIVCVCVCALYCMCMCAVVVGGISVYMWVGSHECGGILGVVGSGVWVGLYVRVSTGVCVCSTNT